MKKIMRKIISPLITSILMFILPITVSAAGGYSVDMTELELIEGQTGIIEIQADNAAGRIDWTSEGAISTSGSAFLDNGNAIIEVTAESVGTGYIHITPTDLATYDGEVISEPINITVRVITDDNEKPEVQEQEELVIVSGEWGENLSWTLETNGTLTISGNGEMKDDDPFTSITLPESITSIGDRAFSYCENLTSITIPQNVTYIGKDAFEKCSELTLTVYRDGYAAQYCKDNALQYTYTDSLDWLND